MNEKIPCAGNNEGIAGDGILKDSTLELEFNF